MTIGRSTSPPLAEAEVGSADGCGDGVTAVWAGAVEAAEGGAEPESVAPTPGAGVEAPGLD